MHELSLLEQLLEIVQDQAQRHEVRHVHRLKLLVGAMSGIAPEALHFAFEAITPGTILANATLEIEELPVVCRCRNCGDEFRPESPIYLCPRCSSRNVDLLQGEELIFDSMETSQ